MGHASTKAGVVVWGSSDSGQLGIGSLSAEERSVPPRLIEGLRGVHVRQVVCNGHYSCAVSESGEVYTWGCGKDGQLGHGDTKDIYTPKTVRALQSKMIRSVSCSENHVSAVSESGVLYTWGKGNNGHLGHGGSDNELLPKPVEALAGQHVCQVSSGDFHTACITSNPNHVLSWGLGLSGRLGHGNETDYHQPTLVESLLGVHVAHISCGGHHTAIISEPAGELLTWGGGAFGKLGHGNRLALKTPKLVAALQNKKVVQASLGPHHSAAVTNKGHVYTWGQAGRLGHASQGAEVDEMIPRQVVALSDVFIIQISCGHSHCAAVTETGDVWAWGSYRAFGHVETSAPPNVPTLVKVLCGKAIVQVSCGVTHSMALSDYTRLTGKAALAAVRSMGANVTAKDKSSQPGTVCDGNADIKKLDRFTESAEGSFTGDDKSFGNLPNERLDSGEGSFHAGMKGLPMPSMEREVAFLSADLKVYQEQTLKLAKLLQESKTKLETLQNENSFLKSELEVMHQCSNDADERLDTLRRHFSERIREMERRYSEKERNWKETFSRLRSHLDIGAMDVEIPNIGIGPDFQTGRRPGTLGHGSSTRGDATTASLVDATALNESGTMSHPGDEAPGHGTADGPLPTSGDSRTDAGRLQDRARAVGRVSSLWPGQS